MRTTNYLKLSALVLGSVVLAACSSNSASTGPSGGSTGGAGTVGGASNQGTGTKANVGGSNVGGNSSTPGGGSPNVGGNSNGTTGGVSPTTGGASNVGGNGGGATGGKASTTTGGSGGATGGKASTSTGGSGGGATGGKASTSTGGSGPATGGASSGPTGGVSAGGAATGGASTGPTGGGNSTGCLQSANVISDFEDTPGKGTVHKVVSTMDGYWYDFEDTTNCGAQTPASVTGGPINSAAVTDTNYTGTHTNAMHSTVTGCSATAYSGFGAELHPDPSDTTGKKKAAVNLSAYDGVAFWVKGTSSSQIYVEFQTTDCIDSANGGTATSSNSDAFNCHGYLIKTVPTSWTQMYVPFGETGIRWFPTSASGGTTTCSNEFCEAPRLKKADIVDVQFALEGPFNQTPTTVASYDVWVDDVTLYKQSDCNTTGLGTWTSSGTYPFPANKTFTNCTMPKNADGQAPDGNLLRDAYLTWKAKYVQGGRVVSPEVDADQCGGSNGRNGTCSVSEGIGYGMLIAVYMGDKDLFDSLWSYWKSKASSKNAHLMNWEITSGGGTTANGGGSATDADEDAAFALQMARKQWGSSYDSDAAAILSDFLAGDVDGSGNLKPGNNFSDNSLFNPSYFAPAYYKYFATVADTGNASKWNGLVSKGYALIASGAGSNGLVPAWCNSTCTTRGGGGYTDADMYQYDAHRVPWRLGVDQCWNGDTNAKSYLDKVVGFFAGLAGAQGDKGKGLGSIGDIYNSGGTTNSDSANNSMSLLGCAGVGAMGSSATNAATFRDRVWAYLLEGHYTKNYMYTDGNTSTKPGYTYYNATVGLLTALTLSGNFYIMQ